jgi:hypothetical protein
VLGFEKVEGKESEQRKFESLNTEIQTPQIEHDVIGWVRENAEYEKGCSRGSLAEFMCLEPSLGGVTY